MSKCRTIIKKIILGFLATISITAHAAPGALSNTPLVVTGYAEPNIMLLIDSSGSMNHVVPDTPFDASVTYGSCPSAQQLSNGSTVYLRVRSDGYAYIYNGNNYAWSTSSGTETITGYGSRCFNPTTVYSAVLNATENCSGSVRCAGSGIGTADYSGNYLNWYFSNNTRTGPDNFGATARYKPGTEIRMVIAKNASTLLVNGLNDVRVGVAKYDSDDGASILYGLSSVKTASDKTPINTAISAISGTGFTPLAEALQEIGRYYIEGKQGETFTLHPGKTYSSTATGSNIFSREPAYGAAASKPSCSGSSCSNMAIQYWCQKSFAVVVTDGLPTFDGNDVDGDLKDYDRDCTVGSDTYKGKGTSAGQCVLNAGEANFADLKVGQTDESSDFLDDVALAMNDIDLRPDLNDGNNTPNEASDKQRVSTYMIGFADPQLAGSQLMIDTAANGGGQFLAASNAAALTSAFQTATQDILTQVSSVASVAFNSSTLNSDSAVFLARFNTNKWSGELFAYPLTGEGVIEPLDWEASSILDTTTTPSQRVIIAHNGTDGVPFQWTTAGIDTTGVPLKNDLAVNAATAANDAYSQQRLDYLRGVRALESGSSTPQLRQRASRLGDIVNSTPVYVGAPQSKLPEPTVNSKFGTTAKPYSLFASTSRTPVLYVGANDGMLHGFNATLGSGSADRGKELIAYIPNIVASTAAAEGLHYLTSPNYQHRFYVDLSPAVADAFINTDPTVAPKSADNSSDQDWRTVLIGGLRNGGKGYFALDVTDPSQFAEANAAALTLWEFTSANDSDLGYTYSEPTIAMMNNGKWGVIFGNGYNSTSGVAQLFILFLENGKDGWTAGDYVEIKTGVGSTTDLNGLSSPQVADLDGNGTADRVYAGDLKGNMWVFDVEGSNTGSWDVAYKSGSTPKPLFTAKDASNNIQPITARPLLAKNIDNISGGGKNLVVMFGTGQYLINGDLSDVNQQTFYVVADVGTRELTRSSLQERVFSESDNLRSSPATQAAMDWSARKGWFMDFDSGTASPAIGAERIISQALLRRRTLFFNTITPDATPCNSGGTGWLMSLDFLTGLNPTIPTFDANNDGKIDSSDLLFIGQLVSQGVIARSGILGNQQYTPTSAGDLLRREVNVGESSLEGRLGWEEVLPD